MKRDGVDLGTAAMSYEWLFELPAIVCVAVLAVCVLLVCSSFLALGLRLTFLAATHGGVAVPWALRLVVLDPLRWAVGVFSVALLVFALVGGPAAAVEGCMFFTPEYLEGRWCRG